MNYLKLTTTLITMLLTQTSIEKRFLQSSNTCPEGKGKSSFSSTCKDCVQSTCKECYSDYFGCEKCKEGYYLDSSFFSSTYTCTSCPSGCSTCTSDYNCKSCKSGYTLSSGGCIYDTNASFDSAVRTLLIIAGLIILAIVVGICLCVCYQPKSTNNPTTLRNNQNIQNTIYSHNNGFSPAPFNNQQNFPMNSGPLPPIQTINAMPYQPVQFEAQQQQQLAFGNPQQGPVPYRPPNLTPPPLGY